MEKQSTKHKPDSALRRKRARLSRKKVIFAATAVVLIVVVALVVNKLLTHPAATAPPYHTVMPSGKTVDDLGGWKRIQPPKNDPIYAYVDHIDGVAIRVSQQPLPASFQTDTSAHVAELAKAYNATDKIGDDNLTLYIGTSAKGPQSVILTRNGLLVLIKSEKKISDISWLNYAGSLK